MEQKVHLSGRQSHDEDVLFDVVLEVILVVRKIVVEKKTIEHDKLVVLSLGHPVMNKHGSAVFRIDIWR
jgi:hypothetical protein